MKMLAELVDLLPTESLLLYIERYEAGQVGEYWTLGNTPGDRGYWQKSSCPRQALGFRSSTYNGFGLLNASVHHQHPAFEIERCAYRQTLDRSALYDVCVMELTKRDEEIRERRNSGESVEVVAGRPLAATVAAAG